MIGGMTYYQILWYFVMYSVLGWIVEVAYHAVTQGKVVNRGFLNGPVCPIYGCGIITIFAAANAVSGGDEEHLNAFLVFLGGMIRATAVELVTGWLLDTIFHMQWWDYSKKPFNFRGYICLEFSVIWGLATVFVVRVIHPMVKAKALSYFPKDLGWILLAVCYAVYAADLVITVMTIRGLSGDLKRMQEFRASLRKVSDDMSEAIGTGTIRAQQDFQEHKVQAALARAEFRDALADAREDAAERRNELQQNAEARRHELEQLAEAHRRELEAQLAATRAKIASSGFFGSRRILKAFPSLRSRQYAEIMEEIRKHLEG